MSAAESLPIAQTPQQPQTSRQFLCNLRDFANNNPGFRNGSIDEIELRVCEGERVEDSEDAQNHIQIAYEYVARRYRFHPDSGQRTITSFELSLIATYEGIALPPHIAVDAYGLADPVEAVEEAGMCTLDRKLTFSVSTSNRVLSACESYTYTDEKGDVVNSVCTCNEQNSVLFSEGVDEDDEGGDAAQYSPYLLEQSRIEHEALDLQTPEEAIELWSTLESLEPTLDEQDDQENLRMANFIFMGMKKALAQQLGVSVERDHP